MTRVFGRLFKVIRRSWQMYPVGFLFGLGFDTASEVALLAISAGAAASSLPFQAVVSLPLIFAAGMSLMDTADGAFMSKAYSWAFSNPIRKVFYNLTVTSLSVMVALIVGILELAQILIQVLGLRGGPFDAVARFDLFGKAGFFIVGLFVVTWLVAFLVFKLRRVEERWNALVDSEVT
jgi:high-affinity nickel-transport protein